MPSSRPRRSAAFRETRRIRMIAAIQHGFSYDEIARGEAISHERVRQIVVESLRRNDEYSRDFRFVQAARLEPALKLAQQKIADGKLEAVDRLVKILDRLDKYLGRAKTAVGGEDVRARLIRRIDMAARQSETEATAYADPPQPVENTQNDQENAWTSEA